MQSLLYRDRVTLPLPPLGFTEVVECENGHKWEQIWMRCQFGQTQIADEDMHACPECGACPVDCDCGDCEDKRK